MTHADIHEESWTSSSYSQANGGECVEWAPEYAAAHRSVPVRDSKLSSGPVLTVSPSAWSRFVDFARSDG